MGMTSAADLQAISRIQSQAIGRSARASKLQASDLIPVRTAWRDFLACTVIHIAVGCGINASKEASHQVREPELRCAVAAPPGPNRFEEPVEVTRVQNPAIT
jgi:hypothetical protein